MSTQSLIKSEGFGTTELAPIVETTATAVAARAKAAVEARAIMAMHRPRDIDNVRVRLLKECRRPGFAATARYGIPRGGKTIEGFTIRFAEAVLRNMGNLDASAEVTFDDGAKQMVRVCVVDLETNASVSMDVTVEKTVERRNVKPDQEVIGTRINSEGKPVYVVATSEDELLQKRNSLVSKAMRTGILRLLPGDIQDECKALIKETATAKTAADPEAARKAIIDGFATIGVLPDALKEYLGVDLGAASPAQLDELRAIFVGIKDGDATWAEIMTEKRGASTAEAKGEQPKSGKLDKLKARMAKGKAAKGEEKPSGTDPATGEKVPPA